MSTRTAGPLGCPSEAKLRAMRAYGADIVLVTAEEGGNIRQWRLEGTRFAPERLLAGPGHGIHQVLFAGDAADAAAATGSASRGVA